ncbi:MAG: MFS transporter [Nitrososphaerota archaeon]|nr:MFS transporter [Nitrososphaerota archaeon]MDG6978921.1 MFS transporter [Nitrososphaerota archaeon]
MGVLMSSIDSTIVLISMPAIFRGIDLDPMTSFQYLIWILFGYMIVTATLLVTFGRISDMYGRVRLYNLGFAIFAAGSVLVYLTPSTGDLGAVEIISFRMVQAVGAAFLFANSSALITDAFPEKELGRALGINQIASLAGSFIGLVVGGTLATIFWRDVFLVSVPVGVVGAVWSYWKLKEVGVITRGQRLDIWGNVTFAAGLTVILVALTYGLLPFGGSSMGWGDPYVVGGIAAGAALLVAFPFIERRVRYPMFRLSLFRIRTFSTGAFAGLLASSARGGVMIMLSILLQGIWLPLHGVSFSDTPFWAGIYLLPLSAGFITMGPVSGWLSDRYGARGLATLGMLITAGTFIMLAQLPYDFYYPEFAVLIYAQGLGMGMFASPNTASIMDSVPREHRGVAAGMRSTLQNTGMMASISMFFAVMVVALSAGLPQAMSSSLAQAGAPPQVAEYFASISPTQSMFSAFLGYNPVSGMLASLPASISSSMSPQTVATLTGLTWFPTTIAEAFMSSLRDAFYVSAGLSVVAALASSLRGKELSRTGEPRAGRSEPNS